MKEFVGLPANAETTVIDTEANKQGAHKPHSELDRHRVAQPEKCSGDRTALNARVALSSSLPLFP